MRKADYVLCAINSDGRVCEILSKPNNTYEYAAQAWADSLVRTHNKVHPADLWSVRRFKLIEPENITDVK